MVSFAAYGTQDTGEAARFEGNVSCEHNPAQLVAAMVVPLVDGVEFVEPIDSVLAVELAAELLVEVEVDSILDVVDAAFVGVMEEEWAGVAKARLEVAA